MSAPSWGDGDPPELDWRMSAALENVPRGDEELAEVTSLEGAVRTWMSLDPEHRDAATLTPERALLIDGALMTEFSGSGITALVERLSRADNDQPASPDDAA